MSILIQYTQVPFKLLDKDGSRFIFDIFRKRYVLLTPEEWVRQNLLRTLVEIYGYPSGLMAVEKELRIAGLKKRYDAVVFDRSRQPWMLIECKAPQVVLDRSTLLQTLNYYRELQCPFLLISNGNDTHIAAIGSGSFRWLDSVPAYDL